MGSSVTGQTITYTATVVPNSPGTGTPAGTVTFTYTPHGGSAITLCSNVSLSSDSATCQDGLFTATNTPYTVSATYNPSPANYGGSNASVTENVSAASTSNAVTNSSPRCSVAASPSRPP